MSYGNEFIISENLSNNLSHKTFDSGGHVALVRHAISVVGSCKRHRFEEYMTCVMFIYTLRGNPMHWCTTLPEKSIHSLAHLVAEIDHAFNHFNHKALDQEILKFRKAPDESVDQFYTHVCNLAYRFPKDEIDWIYGRFEYLLGIFEPRSAHFGDGVAQSQAGTVAVTSDCLPSPHQIAPQPRSDVGDHAHTYVELSHPPTPPALDICTDLACKPIGFHVDSFPQPRSPCFVDHPDCNVFCFPIPDSSPIVNEDQVVDRFGVMQPTYTIIHDEYVRESKEEPMVKDDSLPAVPYPLYPDIPCGFSVADFPYENPFLDVSTSRHSQDILDVSLSSQCREDTSCSENLSNLSSVIL